MLDPAALLQQTETRKFGETDAGRNQPRWGTAHFDEQTRLVLRVADGSAILNVSIYGTTGVLLGRYDPATGRTPEVDLTGFDAEQNGVSRQHARLTVYEHSLYITDLGSANSTFLNGLRLTSHQPRILRDGDEIRLGRLKLQITFIDSTNGSGR